MDLHEQNMHKLSLYYVTLTNYDETYKNVKSFTTKTILRNFREVLEKQTKLKLELQRLKSILTLLFRWTRRAFIGESRILKNSQK
jgi:2,3-bisphosphoglycerate-independent phosphoglycerate mutase